MEKRNFGEGPEREERVDYAYWMGQSTVTQAQFNLFVEAGGYEQSGQFWTKAGWKEKEQRGWMGPDNYGDAFHGRIINRWWGCPGTRRIAFTRWLNDYLARHGLLPEAALLLTCHLEMEYEKAARGGHEIPQDAVISTLASGNGFSERPLFRSSTNERPGRMYPYGNEADIGSMNYSATQIKATHGLGMFFQRKEPVRGGRPEREYLGMGTRTVGTMSTARFNPGNGRL